MKLKRITLSMLFILVFTGLYAQNSVTASGGDASGSGGTVAYSVGQIVYTTNTGIDGTVAQGVQQPYEISVVLEIEQGKDINLNVSAYPNPVTDYLTLKINNSDVSGLIYHLYDINGKLLESKNIGANEISIKMNYLVPANYFLKVTKVDKEIKTFKIIKK